MVRWLFCGRGDLTHGKSNKHRVGGAWNHGIFSLSIQLGISSSQLTFTPSFFRGVGLNHQPDMAISAVSWDSNLHFFPLMVLGEVNGQWKGLTQQNMEVCEQQ
jgi:hypothetical protein